MGDIRITRGMTAQLAQRRLRIAGGEKSLGWKVGFGAPAAMKLLAIDAPLVGHLMQRARLQNNATVPLTGWTKPAAEAEIAVHIGTDLEANADRARIQAAIAGIGTPGASGRKPVGE